MLFTSLVHCTSISCVHLWQTWHSLRSNDLYPQQDNWIQNLNFIKLQLFIQVTELMKPTFTSMQKLNLYTPYARSSSASKTVWLKSLFDSEILKYLIGQILNFWNLIGRFGKKLSKQLQNNINTLSQNNYVNYSSTNRHTADKLHATKEVSRLDFLHSPSS